MPVIKPTLRIFDYDKTSFWDENLIMVTVIDPVGNRITFIGKVQ